MMNTDSGGAAKITTITTQTLSSLTSSASSPPTTTLTSSPSVSQPQHHRHNHNYNKRQRRRARQQQQQQQQQQPGHNKTDTTIVEYKPNGDVAHISDEKHFVVNHHIIEREKNDTASICQYHREEAPTNKIGADCNRAAPPNFPVAAVTTAAVGGDGGGTSTVVVVDVHYDYHHHHHQDKSVAVERKEEDDGQNLDTETNLKTSAAARALLSSSNTIVAAVSSLADREREPSSVAPSQPIFPSQEKAQHRQQQEQYRRRSIADVEDDVGWRRRRQSLRRLSGKFLHDTAAAAATTTTPSSIICMPLLESNTSTSYEQHEKPLSPVLSQSSAVFPSDDNENDDDVEIDTAAASFSLNQFEATPSTSTSTRIIPLCRFHCEEHQHQHQHHHRSFDHKQERENKTCYSLPHNRHHYHSLELQQHIASQNYSSPHQHYHHQHNQHTQHHDDNDNIREKYRLLSQKSKSYWKRLRHMPLAVPPSNWHKLFLRCFQIYNWLWKTQHHRRNELGLSRYHVGELARRIAQLYFNYYVRTSETDFLLQAFKFYNAIRERDYFNWRSFCLVVYGGDGAGAPSQTLQTSQPSASAHLRMLRYMSRLLVTCVLLKKMRYARRVFNEFQQIVECYYSKNYRLHQHFDQTDNWQNLLDTLYRFVQNDQLVVITAQAKSVVLRHRLLAPATPINNSSFDQNFSIEQAVICGNTRGQLLFGDDLQLDMFRFMQTLEWEPSESSADFFLQQKNSNNFPNQQQFSISSSPTTSVQQKQPTKSTSSFETDNSAGTTATSASGCADDDTIHVRAAPKKYMLLRPTFPRFMQTMSHAFNELSNSANSSSGILLLYLSCDNSEDGGVILNSRRQQQQQQQHGTVNGDDDDDTLEEKLFQQLGTDDGGGGGEDCDCLHAADLIPFMSHKPMFIIVDCDGNASEAFYNFLQQQNSSSQCQQLQQCCCALLAPRGPVPRTVANRLRRRHEYGRLLTLFLLSPCTALHVMCCCKDDSIITLEQWVAALATSHEILMLLDETFRAVSETSSTMHQRIFCDTFGRLLLLRFVFFQYVCQMHVDFVGDGDDDCCPRCWPPLPPAVYELQDVQEKIVRCVEQLNCSCEKLRWKKSMPSRRQENS